MHSIGGRCVFASEWDKYSRITYEQNFRHISPELFETGNFNCDINDVKLEEIPDFDVLCAGFPCQPFSQAGLRKGFEDTRGTLFFKVAEIIKNKIDAGKPPKIILLENVKGLKAHDKGNTLKRIIEVLAPDFNVAYEVLNSKNFGVPQNRERIFIVAWPKGGNTPEAFTFPYGIDENGGVIFDANKVPALLKKTRLGDILLPEVDPKYTISDKLYSGHLRRKKQHMERGNGFGFCEFSEDSPYCSTISARYYKDGSEIMIKQNGHNPRRLHPKEAGMLQGFPIGNGFTIVVSDAQAYKQFGNSVSIPVVKTLASEIKKQLLKN